MSAAPPILLRLTRSGRPLDSWEVAVDGADGPARTDARGRLTLRLGPGGHRGQAAKGGERLEFEFTCAAGLRELHVDLRADEPPIEDPSVVRAMPSGRYLPLRLLGRGAVGSVYKCRDAVLDRLVAVKILNEDVAGSEEARRSFLTEGRTLAGIDDDHLIRIYDLGIHDGHAFLVTRFIDGPDLGELVETRGPLPWAGVLATGVQLCRALSAIHRAGLVHQDLKPGNALVDAEGKVFLGDFGLAAPLADVHEDRGTVAGTPAFMSPEQAQGRTIGPASDIYALGATLMHLAAGRGPFQGRLETVLMGHVTRTPPRLSELREGAPPGLDALVDAMLAKDPAERPDGREVERLLGTLLAASAVEDPAEAYLPRLGGRPAAATAHVTARTVASLPAFPSVDSPNLVETRLQGATTVAPARARPKAVRALALLLPVGLVLLLLLRSWGDPPTPPEAREGSPPPGSLSGPDAGEAPRTPPEAPPEPFGGAPGGEGSSVSPEAPSTDRPPSNAAPDASAASAAPAATPVPKRASEPVRDPAAPTPGELPAREPAPGSIAPPAAEPTVLPAPEPSEPPPTPEPSPGPAADPTPEPSPAPVAPTPPPEPEETPPPPPVSF